MNPQRLTAESLTTLDALGLREAYYRDRATVIREIKTKLDAEPSMALRDTLIELSSDAATVFARSDWVQALGYHLAAAELAFQAGATGPELTLDQPTQLAAYNHNVGQVARLLFDAGKVQVEQARFTGPWRTYIVSTRQFDDASIDLADFDSLVPAAYIKLTHTTVTRHQRSGFGAPLVGHRGARPSGDNTQESFMPAMGLVMALTATLDFSAPELVTLGFYNQATTDIATLGQRSVPLAADLTAPLVSLYNYIEDPHIAWKGMRHPDHYLDVMGLYQLAPFQPGKIPVIFSHGLISSPKIWLPSVNTLLSDALIRRHFQLYVFRYPSGFPIGYSASVLRRDLADFQDVYDPEKSNANLRNLLLVGHSMGGLLSSMQIRDSGDSLERLFFSRPIGELEGLDATQKSTLQDLLIYKANPDIRRVVFLAAPHLGSDDATGLRGNIGSKLIDYPSDFLIAEPLTSLNDLTAYGRETVEAKPNGIRSLIPRNPSLTTVASMPIADGIIYHSIIGQKNQRKPLAESTDGTVAYWSSHLDGAASEKIVFAGHTPMVEDPATVEEMRRILYLHAGLPEPAR